MEKIYEKIKRIGRFGKKKGVKPAPKELTPKPETRPVRQELFQNKGGSMEYEAPIIGWTCIQLVCGECGGIMSFTGFDSEHLKYKHRCKCGNESLESMMYPFTRYTYKPDELKPVSESIAKKDE